MYENPVKSPVISRCGVSEELTRTFCGEPFSWQCSKPGESCIAVSILSLVLAWRLHASNWYNRNLTGWLTNWLLSILVYTTGHLQLLWFRIHRAGYQCVCVNNFLSSELWSTTNTFLKKDRICHTKKEIGSSSKIMHYFFSHRHHRLISESMCSFTSWHPSRYYWMHYNEISQQCLVQGWLRDVDVV